MSLSKLITKHAALLPQGFIKELEIELNQMVITLFVTAEIDKKAYDEAKPEVKKIMKKDLKEDMCHRMAKELIPHTVLLETRTDDKQLFTMHISILKPEASSEFH